ncbi:Casein kinase II subunit beta [Paramicrosporidium saccamoebae]|uniref:Casein kinase II subunit beta n=1 Tax=Paramicrosporidium saccamoebae TaxID=1246581 RepID=A0A2H9TI71_9FUNG|nr:Casein kinase II subunit beta [Paramicrosporidium saccamoebae]
MEDSSSGDESPTFADWFTSLSGRSIYAKIPVTYFEDDFNLFEAHALPNFENLLEIVLEDDPPDDEMVEEPSAREALITFYEVVHQRYITSRAGLHEMFVRGEFGRCPRTLCHGEFVLPYGASTNPGQATYKLYCPHCQDVYFPPSRRHAKLDGVGFGPTFSHLLIMHYREKFPAFPPQGGRWDTFVPKVFGFRIHHSSSMACGRGQLRSRPNGYR